MSPRPLKSLRNTLFLKGLFSATLPVILLGLFSLIISGTILFRIIDSRNYAIIHQAELQVERHIEELEQDLHVLAGEMGDGHEIQEHLNRFLLNHTAYSAAWLTDSLGIITHAAPDVINLEGMDRSGTDAFRMVTNSDKKVYFGNTIMSYELKEPVVVISCPFKDGILAVEYRTNDLNRYLSNVSKGSLFSLVLSDRLGTWLVHPESSRVIHRDIDPNTLYIRSLDTAQGRDSSLLYFEGVRSRYVVKKNEQAGWYLTIYQSVKEIASPLLLLFSVLMLVGFVLIVYSVIQNWRMVLRTVGPIERFVDIASAVSKGDYDLVLPEVTFSEFETLKESLLTMVESIHKREIEQKELWEQLIQSQKMEVVGALAGGIAHDFNNILTAIGGFTELLKSELDENSPGLDYNNEIMLSVERASALTRQLLTFSRKEDVQRVEVEVVSQVQSLMAMLHRIVGEDIKLEFHSDVNSVHILADPHHLEQVLLNLTVNAADVLREFASTDPLIRIIVTVIDEEVVLSVQDNGPGIPKSIRNQIFNPFFTTKKVGKGTGMGLSTVRGIIEQNDARIEVDTGHSGTTFRSMWKVCESSAVENVDETEDISRHSFSILFTDDEPMLRKVGKAMLHRLGHDVRVAKDGMEALQILDDNPNVFDLLITDMIMPGGINGTELANRVASQWPEMKIIFLSGYTDEFLNVDEDSHINFLNKPFTIELLDSSIKDAMLS